MEGLTKRKLPTWKNKLKLNKEPLTWNPNTQRIHLSVEYHVLSTIFPFKITPCDDVSNKQTTIKNIDRKSYRKFSTNAEQAMSKWKIVYRNYLYFSSLSTHTHTHKRTHTTIGGKYISSPLYKYITLIQLVSYVVRYNSETTWKSFGKYTYFKGNDMRYRYLRQAYLNWQAK